MPKVYTSFNQVIVVLFLCACSGSSMSRLMEADPYPRDTQLAQNRIIFAYRTLGHFLDNCLSHHRDPCDLTQREKTLLNRIKEHLSFEYGHREDQLEFRSEAEEPGFFFLDGNVRVAKTFAEVGAPIYFNLDLIYRRNHFGELDAIDVGTAVAMLVHEMGHHHDANPAYSHSELDLLGSKVKEKSASQLLVLEDGDRDLEPAYRAALVAINNNIHAQYTTQLWFVGTTDAVNLTDEFIEQGHCPHNIPIRSEYYENYVLGFSFHYAALTYNSNMHWRAEGFGQMVCHCRDRHWPGGLTNCLQVIVPQDPRYIINLDVETNGVGKDYRPGSLRLRTQHRG